MAFQEDIEQVVAEYLRQAQPSARSAVIEDALQVYIAKLDHETQDRILPGFMRRKKARSKPGSSKRRREEITADELDGEADKEFLLALTFLNNRQKLRAQNDSGLRLTIDCGTVRGALTALREGYNWICENDIGAIWTLDDTAPLPESSEGDSPIERLARLYKKTIASVHSGEYKRRILALLIHHECRKSGISMTQGGSEELENLRGLCSQSTNDLRLTAQAWLRFINSWGIGGLMMPGPGQRGVFERELSKEQVKDLWAFCEKHMPDIAIKVGSMHGTVKNLFIKSMQLARLDTTALETVQTPLAEAYRTCWQQGIALPSNASQNAASQLTVCPSSSGLDALAAAAFQQDKQHGQDHHESRPERQHTVLLGRTQQEVLASYETPVSASQQLTTNLMNVTQQFAMGQDLGGQWHPETDFWRQGGITSQRSPFDDASMLALGYDEGVMSLGNPAASLLSNTGRFLDEEWRNFLMEGFQN